MKRRHFLIGAAATAANLLTPDTSRSQSDIGPRLAVSYEDPGQAIALDFIGLSYESAILAGADYFTLNNASTLGLIRALGENGVIRIGDRWVVIRLQSAGGDHIQVRRVWSEEGMSKGRLSWQMHDVMSYD